MVTRVSFEALPGALDVAAIRSGTVRLTDARGETLVVPAVGVDVPETAPVAATE